MRKVLLGLTLALVMTLLPAPAMAAPESDFDALLRGAEEVPPVSTQAMGRARFKLEPNGVFLRYELEVNYLRNPTAAHIHCGPRGVNGPVLVFLYGPYAPGAPAVSGVFATGVFDTRGLACGDIPLLRALASGLAYVNVHTDDGRPPVNVGPGDHPGGEIRGQVFRTPEPPATGDFIVEGLTLAGTQFGTPSGQPTTVPTDPVSLPLARGDDFTYSTITCASAFPPWNNVGLHFDPDFPGVRDPASVRHEFRGTVTETRPGGGEVKGTITTYLCEQGMRSDQIVTTFVATIQSTTATQVPLVGGGPVPTTGGLAFDGSFKVIYGTGRFGQLAGDGTLKGQFTCLPGTLTRTGKQSCAELGAYSEVPFQQRGRFSHPNVLM